MVLGERLATLAQEQGDIGADKVGGHPDWSQSAKPLEPLLLQFNNRFVLSLLDEVNGWEEANPGAELYVFADEVYWQYD